MEVDEEVLLDVLGADRGNDRSTASARGEVCHADARDRPVFIDSSMLESKYSLPTSMTGWAPQTIRPFRTTAVPSIVTVAPVSVPASPKLDVFVPPNSSLSPIVTYTFPAAR